LIHKKVHNQLPYKKLHKLVYINYNLCIRLWQAGMYKREEDPFDKLMELSLYDSQNLIQDWMVHGRSNEDPLLDEDDTQSDTPIPSRIVTQGDDATTLQRITGKLSLVNWANETVGDTHIGKRKQKTMSKKSKVKIRRDCLEVMRRLLARDRDQNTKNPTLTVLPSTVTMAGMTVPNTI
jgi:hypothetical protein